MIRALGSLVPIVLLLSPPAFADDAKCACGKTAAECQKAGCSCGSPGECPMHGKMGMGMGMKHGMHAAGLPVFDAKTVTTIKGEVTAVERFAQENGPVGLHLRVKSGDATYFVALGPSPFVDPKLTFAEKDQVEVSGSKVTFDGGPALIATLVKKGDTSLKLRKPDGTPLCRGMRLGTPAPKDSPGPAKK